MSNGNITHFSFKTNNKMKNIILEKTEEFGKKISRLNIYLIKEKHEYTRSDQILRSGTSIGGKCNGRYLRSITCGFYQQNEHCIQRGSRNKILA